MNDEELRMAVSGLLERGGLDKGEPAYSCAQIIKDHGYNSLTRMQRQLFERVVRPVLEKDTRPEGAAEDRPVERSGAR